MTIHPRADRAVFRFSGPEAHKLVNDVVTGRIPTSGTDAAWWALLSPQGKMLAEGLAGWHEDALWLDVDAAAADDFLKRMRMYRLRANVEITDLRNSHRVFWSRKEISGIAHRDVRLSVDLGWRLVAPAEAALEASADSTAFDVARIQAGLPQLGPDIPAGDAFAHDFGLDILGGIDFDKGCYVGQEVVSRMKHRGTARRRPVIVSGLPPDAEPGAPVMAGGREAGRIGRIAEGCAVAILRLDHITDPAAASMGGTPVALALPAWASYGFGDAVPTDA